MHTAVSTFVRSQINLRHANGGTNQGDNEGNHYMVSLFAWGTRGRRDTCFFPWEPGGNEFMSSLFAWEPGGSTSFWCCLATIFILPIVSTMSGFYTICLHRGLQGFNLFSKAHCSLFGRVVITGRVLPVLKFPFGGQLLLLVPSASAIVG
jgi:hypothetical protein